VGWGGGPSAWTRTLMPLTLHNWHRVNHLYSVMTDVIADPELLISCCSPAFQRPPGKGFESKYPVAVKRPNLVRF